jgi:hypothetical protein
MTRRTGSQQRNFGRGDKTEDNAETLRTRRKRREEVKSALAIHSYPASQAVLIEHDMKQQTFRWHADVLKQFRNGRSTNENDSGLVVAETDGPNDSAAPGALQAGLKVHSSRSHPTLRQLHKAS